MPDIVRSDAAAGNKSSWRLGDRHRRQPVRVSASAWFCTPISTTLTLLRRLAVEGRHASPGLF